VVPYPGAGPYVQRLGRVGHYTGQPIVGVVGDTFRLLNRSTDSSAPRLWRIGQDAGITSSTADSVHVAYKTPGPKSATLTITNINGCSSIGTVNFEIASCNPAIPADAHIVTGTESGGFKNVWVKAGGTYTSSFAEGRIYVDGGGAIAGYNVRGEIVYMKAGSSLNFSQPDGNDAVFILDRSIVLKLSYDEAVDTFYCNDLQFDYSLINTKSVATSAANSIATHLSKDDLVIEGLPATSTLAVFDLLGRQVVSNQETHSSKATIGTASLPSGVYYLHIASEGVVQSSKFLVRR
jgi:PKD repeat protein